MRSLLRHVFSRQFLKYFCGGVAANVIDIGIFYVLLYMDVWYIHAQIAGGVTGFLSAFVLHKYLVFQAQGGAASHFARFCIMGLFNLVMITLELYLLVDVLSIPEEFSKIIANGSVVLWNYFIYKFFVYV